jgi:hypothetical protein
MKRMIRGLAAELAAKRAATRKPYGVVLPVPAAQEYQSSPALAAARARFQEGSPLVRTADTRNPITQQWIKRQVNPVLVPGT